MTLGKLPLRLTGLVTGLVLTCLVTSLLLLSDTILPPKTTLVADGPGPSATQRNVAPPRPIQTQRLRRDPFKILLRGILI